MPPAILEIYVPVMAGLAAGGTILLLAPPIEWFDPEDDNDIADPTESDLFLEIAVDCWLVLAVCTTDGLIWGTTGGELSGVLSLSTLKGFGTELMSDFGSWLSKVLDPEEARDDWLPPLLAVPFC